MVSERKVESLDDDVQARSNLETSPVFNGDLTLSGHGSAFVNNTFSQSILNVNDSSEEHAKTRSHIDKKFKHETREEALLGSLFFREYQLRQESVEPADEGTYQWIFKSSEKSTISSTNANEDGNVSNAAFAEFLLGTDTIFWITGKPGSGKSTLASHVLSHSSTKQYLSQWASGNDVLFLSYFFWKPGTPLQQSAVGLLRSLSYQLAKKFPSVTESFLNKVDDHCHIPSWTARKLQQAFLYALDSFGGPIFILIDGIDEAGKDCAAVLSILQEISSSTKVKMVVTSRDEIQIRRNLQTAPQLAMQDFNFECILAHATTQLAFSAQCEILGRDIAYRSQGVFLWARIVTMKVVEALKNKDSDEIIRNMLNKMPTELEHLYNGLFNDTDQMYKELALKYFKDLIIGRRLYNGRLWYPGLSNLFLFFLVNADDAEQYIDGEPCSTHAKRKILLESCQNFRRHLVVRTHGMINLHEEEEPELVWRPSIFKVQASTVEGGQSVSTVYDRQEVGFDDEENVLEKLLQVQWTTIGFIHRSVFEFFGNILFKSGELTALDNSPDHEQVLRFLRAYSTWTTRHVHLDSLGRFDEHDKVPVLQDLVTAVATIGNRMYGDSSAGRYVDDVRGVMKYCGLFKWLESAWELDSGINGNEDFRDNIFVVWIGIHGMYDYAWHEVNKKIGPSKSVAIWFAMTMALPTNLFVESLEREAQCSFSEALLDRVETDTKLKDDLMKKPSHVVCPYNIYDGHNWANMGPMCFMITGSSFSRTVITMFADTLLYTIMHNTMMHHSDGDDESLTSLFDRVLKFLLTVDLVLPICRISIPSGIIKREYVVYTPLDMIARAQLGTLSQANHSELRLRTFQVSEPVEHVAIVLTCGRDPPSSHTDAINSFLSLCWPGVNVRTAWRTAEERRTHARRPTCPNQHCFHGMCCLVALLRVAQEESNAGNEGLGDLCISDSSLDDMEIMQMGFQYRCTDIPGPILWADDSRWKTFTGALDNNEVREDGKDCVMVRQHEKMLSRLQVAYEQQARPAHAIA